MPDTPEDETRQLLWTTLNSETARIPWQELARHFARGVVIRVSPELDLVEVAVSISLDDKARVEAWTEADLIGRAEVDEARDWHERDPELWAVVTAPWILVQERTG